MSVVLVKLLYMDTFDDSQQLVRSLLTSGHARVLGAAGSGKTRLIVERAVEWIRSETFNSTELQIMVHQRTEASAMRDRIEQKLNIPLTGTLVRTPTALAFAICNEERALQGLTSIQLMSGSRQDEMIRLAVREFEGTELEGIEPEVLDGTPFRTELRDLWRVLDEFSLDPKALSTEAARFATESSHSELFEQLAKRWRVASIILHRALMIAADRHPGERAASGIMRDATAALADPDASISQDFLPKLILVDDAADLTEGALAMCAGLANRGTKLWFFGDPDTSTAAFQGEATRVLATPHAELMRRGAQPLAVRTREQQVVLTTVYRHGDTLRNLLMELTEKIGVSGGWEQRLAKATEKRQTLVEFTKAQTFSEQLGIIAYRLRHRHLGLGPDKIEVPWHEMAVICRSREQVEQVSSALQELKVPTTVSAGGIVLRKFVLVQDLLRLVQHAMGFAVIEGHEVPGLLLGQIGGLDPISLRRLVHTLTLEDRRIAYVETREPRSLSDNYLFYIEHQEEIPDLSEGRALKKLARVIKEAKAISNSGGTAREVLWALWSASGLSDELEGSATGDAGPHATQAHNNLDAVIELFYTFQRHEEQTSTVPVDDFIQEILTSDVPQDSLAMHSARSAVAVTTPHGVSTREFRVVCIAGPQDGVWPNMRSRGSIAGAQALQQVLRGGMPDPYDRTQTLHEELRLFASALSRASHELLVVAREDEEEFPSLFFRLGAPFLVTGLNNSTLTLRGYTAQLRRRLLHNSADAGAAESLAYLAQADIRGASPDEWYGVRELSTVTPLVDLEGNPDSTVSVSPSQIETAEDCPLNWFVSSIGADYSSTSAQLGTLVHHALELAGNEGELAIRKLIDAEWEHLQFDAVWEAEQQKIYAHQMAESLSEYLRVSADEGIELFASEANFNLTVGQATLRGKADRIEMVRGEDGTLRPRIVDLKTGKSNPSAPQAQDHAQLLAYQLGLLLAEFSVASHNPEEPPTTFTFNDTAGAALLYVHPNTWTTKRHYRLVDQATLTPEKQTEFQERISSVARIMAASNFEARVEHHCTTVRYATACQLHIIPAVSYE